MFPKFRIRKNKEKTMTDDAFIFPLSFAQQRLWLLDQLEPGNPAYNIVTAARLTGSLHVTALEQSLGEIVRRHEALRTLFVSAEDGPAQIVLPSLLMTLRQVDLRALPRSDPQAKALAGAQEESQSRVAHAHG